MKFSGTFPLGSLPRRTCEAFLLAALIATLQPAALASNGNKPASKPVARLLTTSPQQVPAPTKARLLARAVPAPSSYAARSAAPVSAAAAVTATSDERRAFELINAERRARGRSPLAWDGQLTRVARYHSANMARQGFFNHTDRDGLDLTGRVDVHGLTGWRALGENIAYNQGYEDPVSFAVERWMISDTHRENILNGNFTHAGLGISRGADGRVFFTQVFMTR